MSARKPATLRDMVTAYVAVVLIIAGGVAAFEVGEPKWAAYGLLAALLAVMTIAVRRPPPEG